MDTKISKKLDKFFAGYKLQKYKKGEILIRAEEDISAVFYLKEGVVKRYAVSPQGKELILNIYKPVSFFPMDLILNNAKNNHYYEAVTGLVVWKAPKEKIIEFIKSEPDILLDLLSRVYKGLAGFFLRMEYLMAGSARSSLVAELLIYAKRFGEKKGSSTRVKLKITEKELASQSGITRETVNREFKKLKEKKLINFHKGILTIHNLPQLESEL